MGWQWPGAGLGTLQCSAAVPAWNSLKDVPLSSLPPPQFGLRSNNREGTQPCPSTENQDERYTEHGPTHQNKTQFPPQSVSPIRKFPRASYPFPSEDRQTENHNHRKLNNLITWITALSNSMKLPAMPCGATQDRWVMV